MSGARRQSDRAAGKQPRCARRACPLHFRSGSCLLSLLQKQYVKWGREGTSYRAAVIELAKRRNPGGPFDSRARRMSAPFPVSGAIVLEVPREGTHKVESGSGKAPLLSPYRAAVIRCGNPGDKCPLSAPFAERSRSSWRRCRIRGAVAFAISQKQKEVTVVNSKEK
eukprot:scaffold89962_cov27-Tisochrysis_lutea.AAC.2